ncbi:hypothetical protein, partial [Streptomyces antimycoticus]|nr:hypothetical protein [Streptomyces sp. DSM 41602]
MKHFGPLNFSLPASTDSRDPETGDVNIVVNVIESEFCLGQWLKTCTNQEGVKQLLLKIEVSILQNIRARYQNSVGYLPNEKSQCSQY